MSERHYDEWSGNPKGVPENKTKCIAQVMHGYRFVQCSRSRGYGHTGEYCVQHAKREK